MIAGILGTPAFAWNLAGPPLWAQIDCSEPAGRHDDAARQSTTLTGGERQGRSQRAPSAECGILARRMPHSALWS